MSIILILFLLSLSAIAVMIGRKLVSVRQGDSMVIDSEEVLFEIPYINEVKELTTKNVKRYGYLGLVTTIRLYFRSSNLVKHAYRGTKGKVKIVIEKNRNLLPKSPLENQEVSRFLESVSEYKQKLSKIKHKIKEEEKVL
jgi:hypothetical protein